ncbi:MAG: GNAT family N-acetyltransferase [Sphaerochaetaceae bacterium]|nr:GNAT family N-acetyltransferase [Sphaerochaetaceae bacterium]
MTKRKKAVTVEYRKNSASQEAIHDHLVRCSLLFSPRLDSYVNIRDYAAKIYRSAERIEAWDNQRLIGLLAVYLNDHQGKEGFITDVSVEKEFHGNSIGADLLRRCLDLATEKGFRTVILEVFTTNIAAIRLYEKFGFLTETTKGEKLIMKWEDDGRKL